MMDKKLMFIGLILAVFISGCTQQQGTTQTDQSTTQTLPPELTNDGGLNDALSDLDQVAETVTQSTATANTVEMISAGFNPTSLTVNLGDTVTFVNKDTAPHWPASNAHPTHTIYPGFDALKPLSTGESYSFTFTKIGAWNYHDHLNPSLVGTIVVQVKQ